jgi:hypothetical protein
MKRSDVHDVLDDERDYQDKIWGSPTDEDYTAYPISQYILDFENLVNQLKTFGFSMDDEKALDTIRKIGALSVKCGEVHDLPKRNWRLNHKSS